MVLIRKISFIGILFFLGCKASKVEKGITSQLNRDFYNTQFTGVLVYNPRTHDTVFSYNANKYFIPASNVKIATLYSALKLLPDSVPAYKYSIEQDTINILGTGDPTFLHPYFKDSTLLKNVKKYKKVHVVLHNLEDDKYGPGWAWEDYDAYFSPERSSFPLYGNVLSINNSNNELSCVPKILTPNVKYSQTSKKREYNENRFFYNLVKTDTVQVPMVLNNELINKLWVDLLEDKVSITAYSGNKMEHVAYGVPSDSLYKRMMLVSDNFLAEQMLVLASSLQSEMLSSKNIRTYILNTSLNDLKQKPRWVDGSGLSRYNLFTPTLLVQILEKLYIEIPQKRLFNFFPIGGESGTLKHNFSGTQKPYIYAKSGTVGNNYSLSGYLITNSGEILIFSFMNNHYTTSTKMVKDNMQDILEWLRDTY
ncbi:MAG: D-alanyl-D-alanine carboxypeptidase [Aestuariibaculum sp.]